MKTKPLTCLAIKPKVGLKLLGQVNAHNLMKKYKPKTPKIQQITLKHHLHKKAQLSRTQQL
jgi:hypothetical protein